MLRALEAGHTRESACSIAGISRRTLERHVRANEAFAEDVDVALGIGNVALERVVRRAATEPQVDVRRRQVTTGQGVVELVETITRPPDARLALDLLRRCCPEWRLPREMGVQAPEIEDETFDLTIRLHGT